MEEWKIGMMPVYWRGSNAGKFRLHEGLSIYFKHNKRRTQNAELKALND